MTGRVLTQPELCELPPSVLLLLPLSPSATPALSPLVSRIVVPFLAACSSSSFLEEESFGTTYPIRLSCDAYASDSHSDVFFLLFFFVDRKARTKASLARARYDRAGGEGESVHFQSIRTHARAVFSRRLGQRKRRARAVSRLRGVYGECGRQRERSREGATAFESFVDESCRYNGRDPSR